MKPQINIDETQIFIAYYPDYANSFTVICENLRDLRKNFFICVNLCFIYG